MARETGLRHSSVPRARRRRRSAGHLGRRTTHEGPKTPAPPRVPSTRSELLTETSLEMLSADLLRATVGDHAAIATQANSLKRDHAAATRVTVSTARDVTLEELVAVIVAALGPDCAADGSGCILREVVLSG